MYSGRFTDDIDSPPARAPSSSSSSSKKRAYQTPPAPPAPNRKPPVRKRKPPPENIKKARHLITPLYNSQSDMTFYTGSLANLQQELVRVLSELREVEAQLLLNQETDELSKINDKLKEHISQLNNDIDTFTKAAYPPPPRARRA
jgi:hypothetical protein